MKSKKFRSSALVAVMLFAVVVMLAMARTVEAGDALVVFRDQSSEMQTKSVQSALNAENLADVRVIKTFDAIANLIDTGKTEGEVVQVNSASSHQKSTVFALVHSDTVNTSELVAILKAREGVIAVSPNYQVHAAATDTGVMTDATIEPNDPGWRMSHKDVEYLWGVKAVSAPEIWETGVTGTEDVYVALIDTGIDYEQPDLSANFCREYSRNFWYETDATTGEPVGELNPNDFMDYCGHGTHIAGTIAAVGNNGRGVVGMAWTAKLIALRALGPMGEGTFATIIDALNYATELMTENPNMKLTAINMSIAGYSAESPEDQKSNPLWVAMKAVDDLNRAVMVVAAGNGSFEVGKPAPKDGGKDYKKGDYVYPASFTELNNMVTVGAVNPDLSQADFSNYGADYVHVAAPGVQIASTLSNEYHLGLVPTGTIPHLDSTGGTRIALLKGTSMAVPHVVGAAVLFKSKYPNATAWQIRSALVTGTSLTASSENFTKCGLFDAKKSLDWLDANIATYPKTPSDPEDNPIGGSGGGSGCGVFDLGAICMTALAVIATLTVRRKH